MKIPRKEIGWAEIGEQFTRYQILKTRWFNIYVHRLVAPTAHKECHNHPWSFLTIILRGGYRETLDGVYWNTYGPGTILYRKAEQHHNVTTDPGVVSWSLLFTGPNRRIWGFVPCGDQDNEHQIPFDTYRAIYTHAKPEPPQTPNNTSGHWQD